MDRSHGNACAQWAERLMGPDVVRGWGPETWEVVHSVLATMVSDEFRWLRFGTDRERSEGDTDAYLRRVLIAGCEGLLQSLRAYQEQDSSGAAPQGAAAVPGHGKENVPGAGGALGAHGSRSVERGVEDPEVLAARERRNLYR